MLVLCVQAAAGEPLGGGTAAAGSAAPRGPPRARLYGPVRSLCLPDWEHWESLCLTHLQPLLLSAMAFSLP